MNAAFMCGSTVNRRGGMEKTLEKPRGKSVGARCYCSLQTLALAPRQTVMGEVVIGGLITHT